jgi:hypothetical protein
VLAHEELNDDYPAVEYFFRNDQIEILLLNLQAAKEIARPNMEFLQISTKNIMVQAHSSDSETKEKAREIIERAEKDDCSLREAYVRIALEKTIIAPVVSPREQQANNTRPVQQ